MKIEEEFETNMVIIDALMDIDGVDSVDNMVICLIKMTWYLIFKYILTVTFIE